MKWIGLARLRCLVCLLCWRSLSQTLWTFSGSSQLPQTMSKICSVTQRHVSSISFMNRFYRSIKYEGSLFYNQDCCKAIRGFLVVLWNSQNCRIFVPRKSSPRCVKSLLVTCYSNQKTLIQTGFKCTNSSCERRSRKPLSFSNRGYMSLIEIPVSRMASVQFLTQPAAGVYRLWCLVRMDRFPFSPFH